jgi:diacylglycerol kinase family enzyme
MVQAAGDERQAETRVHSATPVRRFVAVVLNGAAGALLRRQDARESLQQLFHDAGLAPEFVPPEAGNLPERIDIACSMETDAVVVAGGDGTVTCAAERLTDSGIALGILPFGTMNLLAKDLAIPVGDVEAAIRIIADGEVRAIDVGEVNGRVFLCASMLGLPARLGRHREAHRGRFAPWRMWSRFASAALRALTRQLRLRMDVRIDATTTALRVPSLTIAVNALDAACPRLFARARLDGGELAVYVIDRLRLRDLLRLAARLLGGRLLDGVVLTEIRAQEVVISRRRGAFRVMNDGEVMLLASPLHYRVRPRALRVLAPAVPA